MLHNPNQPKAALFVHFDFMFFPLRVHSGEGTLQWDGHEWKGVGEVLRVNATSSSSLGCRPEMAASLPLDAVTREVQAREYYRNRRMEWIVCSLTEDGDVLDKVSYTTGVMVECSQREDLLTFRAEGGLYGTAEKDERHRGRVESIRRQFSWELKSHGRSSGANWLINLLTGTANGTVSLIGLAVDLARLGIPGQSQRSALQRWSARKRVFWLRTEPKIPGMILWPRGYRIRADTLEEAMTCLYGRAARRIWDFPPGWMMMLVYVDGKPWGGLDLDSIRKQDDPQRWEETSPVRKFFRE